MAEKYNLPAFLLWASVIISATLLGVMVPEARTFPLIVALMFFTALYHSALLASSLANCRPNNITGRCQFYMDPLDGAHMGWTLGFVIFWLSVFVLRFAAVVKGIAEEDRDFVLAVFSGVELVLNVRIAYLTLVKWRSRASLRCRHQLHDHDVEDLESGQAYDSMEYVWRLFSFYGILSVVTDCRMDVWCAL